MKDEILDEIETKSIENKIPISRITQIAIGSVFLFHLIEKSREIFPKYLFGIEPITNAGLLIMMVIILNAIIIPNNLNKISPELSIFQVVICTGLILMGIEITFKMTQNIFIFKNSLKQIQYVHVFRPAILMGMLGLLMANIRTHKLRNKKTLIPILLLIGIWIIIGLIFKK